MSSEKISGRCNSVKNRVTHAPASGSSGMCVCVLHVSTRAGTVRPSHNLVQPYPKQRLSRDVHVFIVAVAVAFCSRPDGGQDLEG